MLHNPDGVIDVLSPREKETLDLFLQLGRQKTVASCMGLSHKTIAAYMASIQRKLGVKGLVGLVRYCIRKGIIDA